MAKLQRHRRTCHEHLQRSHVQLQSHPENVNKTTNENTSAMRCPHTHFHFLTFRQNPKNRSGKRATLGLITTHRQTAIYDLEVTGKKKNHQSITDYAPLPAPKKNVPYNVSGA